MRPEDVCIENQVGPQDDVVLRTTGGPQDQVILGTRAVLGTIPS